MAEKKEKYPINPSPEQLKEWKEIHGCYYTLNFPPDVEIEKDENGDDVEKEVYPATVAYLKPPSRRDLAYAQQSQTTGGNLAFNSALLNNCFLGGDPIVKTKDSYFLGAGPYLAEIIEIKECKLEKH